MAVRKATRPSGYDNCAFSYRWLDSSQTPLDLTTHIFGSNDNNTPGRRLVNKHGTQDNNISVEGLMWLNNLATFGRDFDRVYRVLADEYYRELECEMYSQSLRRKKMCNKCCKCCCDDSLSIDDLVKGQRYRVVKSHLKTTPEGCIVMCISTTTNALDYPFKGYRGVANMCTGDASILEVNLVQLRFERI